MRSNQPRKLKLTFHRVVATKFLRESLKGSRQLDGFISGSFEVSFPASLAPASKVKLNFCRLDGFLGVIPFLISS